MATLTEKESEFLENPFVGIVTTLRGDGSLHSTVVWVDAENGSVSFNTVRGRAKERHLTADPRLSLLVIDPDDPFRWVAVSGRGELVEEGADEQIDRLAKKYTGEESFTRPADQRRVSVKIHAEHVESTGL
jgi:PPOX class probable F420-dependent enzyme